MEEHHLEALLWASSVLLGAVAVLVGIWQVQNRRRLGRVRLRLRGRRRVRLALILGAAVLVGLLAWADPLGRSSRVLAIGLLSVWLIASSPGFQDSIWGESGVQRGWYARRYTELEQWRLVGEHLRWQLFGVWVSTDVPSSEHAALRRQLEAQAPGRESMHGNAGFDPQRAAAAKSKS